MTRFDEADYTLGFEHTRFDGPGTGDVRDLLGQGSCLLPSSSTTSAADGAVWPSPVSSVADLPSDDARLYTALGVMCAAAIEAAFSGQDGTLREFPEPYQRTRDAR